MSTAFIYISIGFMSNAIVTRLARADYSDIQFPVTILIINLVTLIFIHAMTYFYQET